MTEVEPGRPPSRRSPPKKRVQVGRLIDGEVFFHFDLQCYVSEIRYSFKDRIGVALLGEGSCTDMCGAISLFQRIDPDVKQVQTYAKSDNRPGWDDKDTIYTRIGNGKWHPGIVGEWRSDLPERQERRRLAEGSSKTKT